MITTADVDCLIIGAGAAGMAAAEVIAKNGFSVVIIDRENQTGGILQQCIHNGFGLHHFGKELTGPEYAEEFSDRLQKLKLSVFLETTVVNIIDSSDYKKVITCSAHYGVMVFNAKTVILAMGCRERNRGNIGIPGSRPAGIFTAGLAQRLLNVDGYIPGKRAVIIGSGDIGLIMARRLRWVGSEVATVVEVLPYPSGLTRNIVQCLQDFSIPLQLSHSVTDIFGKDRVEGIEIAPLENGIPDMSKSSRVACDTVLLSVGLIPENELSRKIGIVISPNTNGPVVDHCLQTSVSGVFACGNVLHVHDLVDFVTEEAQICGMHVLDYLTNSCTTSSSSMQVESGANMRYVTPNRCAVGKDQHFFMRSLVIRKNTELIIQQGTKIVEKLHLKHVRPAEMISLNLPGNKTVGLDPAYPLTFSLL